MKLLDPLPDISVLTVWRLWSILVIRSILVEASILLGSLRVETASGNLVGGVGIVSNLISRLDLLGVGRNGSRVVDGLAQLRLVEICIVLTDLVWIVRLLGERWNSSRAEIFIGRLWSGLASSDRVCLLLRLLDLLVLPLRNRTLIVPVRKLDRSNSIALLFQESHDLVKLPLTPLSPSPFVTVETGLVV